MGALKVLYDIRVFHNLSNVLVLVLVLGWTRQALITFSISKCGGLILNFCHPFSWSWKWLYERRQILNYVLTITKYWQLQLLFKIQISLNVYAQKCGSKQVRNLAPFSASLPTSAEECQKFKISPPHFEIENVSFFESYLYINFNEVTLAS